MKKLIKFVGYTLASILAFYLLSVVYVTNAERIDAHYARLFWKLPTQIKETRVGDAESDIIFKLGQPTVCATDNEMRQCDWGGGGLFSVRFRDGLVSSFYTQGEFSSLFEIPFKDVKTMEFILGKPNIFSESKDFSRRAYTYLYEGQKVSGVTFGFENNRLTSYSIGKIAWRGVTDIGRYEINGEQICPSEKCPWDSKDNLRDEFKAKDATWFMKN